MPLSQTKFLYKIGNETCLSVGPTDILSNKTDKKREATTLPVAVDEFSHDSKEQHRSMSFYRAVE